MAPSSNYNLSDVVNSDNVLNASSGATSGNTTFIGTVSNFTKTMVQLIDVYIATDLAKQINTERAAALAKMRIRSPFSYP